MPMQLDGPGFAPLSGGKAVYLVILLHGVAANGNDLVSLARAWRKILPKAEFIAPNAPFPSDHAPEARQWFSLEDRAPEKMLAGLREAGAILDRFFDELLASLQLGDARLALAGFSQGAATALYAGLRRQTQIAGIVAFSGAPPGAEELQSDIRSKPPVLLVHGVADDVVLFQSMANTKATLEAVGVPVTAVARPGLGHAIDDAGIALGGEFLRNVLKAPRGDTGVAV
ncbi:MAG TPA: dienelactone hydrolase family protein [Methylocella sp.]|jgi:phospholipase/carboxylesterase|nr:dienelactone hydrolase family protein [Methylocella sp.]